MDYRIIKSTQALQELYGIKHNGVAAVDTETNGLSRFAKIVGLSFTFDGELGYYIPIQLWNGEKLYTPWKDLTLVEGFTKYLLNLKLIMHNAPFDCKIFHNWLGRNPIDNVICDTALLAHTVYNEEGPIGLKPLATLLIDPAASAPQLDVKASVAANGGTTTKDNYEMYKCDYDILGRYAAYDALYTFKLYEKLYPEIEKQGLQNLWNLEVMPLLKVSYELNTNGIGTDQPYFKNLKQEIEHNIESIETELYDLLRDKVKDYELQSAKDDCKMTPGSGLGKKLISLGLAEKVDKELHLFGNVDPHIIAYYKEKKGVKEIINFDSGDDKAFIFYDVLGLDCPKETKSGKRATDKATLDLLCEQNEDSSPILKKFSERSKEKKMLSTYIEPLIEHSIDGVMYTGFNQTGTTSGRYSSSKPFNIQTLPRTDLRVKGGLIAGKGYRFVSADYSSLEPRCFVAACADPKLLQIYAQDLDMYSQIAIDVFGLKGISAKESDDNYLKKKDPEKRQASKIFSLATVYGAQASRISKALGVTFEEAEDMINAYMKAYPKLKQWISSTKRELIEKGYTQNIVGRKRRSSLVYDLSKKYYVKDFSKEGIKKVFGRLKDKYPEYTTANDLYYACKHNLDNAVNFKIQSLAASICNQAMIDFCKQLDELGLKSKLTIQVHDSVTVRCPDEEVEQVSELLKKCMEDNRVTRMISVKMVAAPVVCDTLLEDK